MKALKRHLCRLAVFVLFAAPSAGYAFPARFGVSPDNSSELILSTLKTARQHVLINIYELENERIADGIIERIRAGVSVKLLLEREPFGKISQEGERILHRVLAEMRASRNAGNQIFLMTQGQLGSPTKRRFRYDHAKYAVIDGRRAWVSSENFSEGGHPVRGEIGNRGWQTVLENPRIAAQLTQLFFQDADPSHGDIVEMQPGHQLPVQKPGPAPRPKDKHRRIPPLPIGTGDVRSVSIITSPQAVEPVRQLIQTAQRLVDVQHMNLPHTWRDENYQIIASPFVAELVEAARRGVRVRMLMNDENAFGTPEATAPSEPVKKKPNDLTAKFIQQLAACERLPIEARIVSTKNAGLSYIHNKGMLIDGKRAMVSSINGTANSFRNNRELAVVLESTDATRYYGTAFQFDWNQSPAFDDGVPVQCASHFRLMGLLGL